MFRGWFVTSGLIALASLASACATKTLDCDAANNCIALEDTGTEGEGDTEDEGDTGGTSDPPLYINKDVDILFVIDNSGSMGEEQALLAANVGSFIEVLEQKGVDANYRIGITTTDNGNPWCPAGTTTPEAGKLVLSSCKHRLGDFLFGNDVDVRDLACNDICTLDDFELEILPTTTDVDPNPAPRPWLERIEGKKNIPDSTSTADAFRCFGPQGVNGCGFESQLESMYLALVRAQTPDEASYGFIRPNAILAVVIVTDEADCSSNKDWSVIFDADGNKAFWSDPTAAYPTSAVCWNAGVECHGDPSGYSECVAVDKDVNGNLTGDPASAVLHPMSRYVGLLQGIEDQKRMLNADQDIIVALIGGVDSGGQPHYADVGASDPGFQDNFGIGPGCQAPNPLDPNSPIQAVPPVRLRDLTEAFTPNNMFSICDNDYSPALAAIANRIGDQIQPACYTRCAADTNPDTPVLEPQCTVAERPLGQPTGTPIPECLRDGQGYVIDPQTNDHAMPSDDANVCFAYRVDPGGFTPDPHDDMSPQCVDEGWNLEFVIVRRPGFPAAGGTSIKAECLLAADPAVTCPGL
ncbi:MAG: hypothetical protein R6X02_16840 [Enhygromyxa sp.]